MNPYRQACLSDQQLSKSTLLAMLDSKLDPSRAIVATTGEVIDISQTSINEIKSHLDDGSWVYYEENNARRLLLTNPDWRITSFNPATRSACVSIFTKYGMRVLNFSLIELSPKY